MSRVLVFGSALSMTIGLGILIGQLLIIAWRIIGLTGVGLSMTLLAVVMFGLHLWLEDEMHRLYQVYEL